MKKILLASAIALLSLPAFADGEFLLFKTADGVSHSIAASGLEIKFEDGAMVATNASESLSLPLSDLATMEFAASNAVSSIVSSIEGTVAVMNINGVMLGNYASAEEAANYLAPGIYVIRNASGESSKLLVRK